MLVLFAVGTTLEAFAFDRSRRSVAELSDLAPERARIVGDDGSERLVPVEEVTVGACFAVRPGERIALDGEVTGGSSSVDEAPITGESMPVDKEPGSAVFAGTLNAQGALTVRATRAAGDSTLARVAALVDEAQGSRAPSERFVDRFARVYTPLVFAGGARRPAPRGRARRQLRHVGLPGARAAHRRLPVLARHLDPGRRRLRGRARGA